MEFSSIMFSITSALFVVMFITIFIINTEIRKLFKITDYLLDMLQDLDINIETYEQVKQQQEIDRKKDNRDRIMKTVGKWTK